MSGELARLDDSLQAMGPAGQLAERIANTDFVPVGLRGRPEAVLAAILTGREVGIPAMQALAKIHVIKGRPTMAAELMRAVVLQAGHRIWTEEYTSHRVTLCGRRFDAGPDEVFRVTWTLDDAKRAGLAGQANWRAYPRAMLLARATSELCRLAFADAIGGIGYVPEDFDDAGEFIPEVAGDVVEEPAAKRRTRSRLKPPEKPAPESMPGPPLPPLPGEEDDTPEVVDAEIVEGEPIPDPPEPEPKRDLTDGQRLALYCRDRGLDDQLRHDLVRLVTVGRTDTANGCDPHEANLVRLAADCIRDGDLDVVYDHDGLLQLQKDDGTFWQPHSPADPDPNFTTTAAALPSSKAEWVAFANAHGLNGNQLLVRAREIARTLNSNGDLAEPPPRALDDITPRQATAIVTDLAGAAT